MIDIVVDDYGGRRRARRDGTASAASTEWPRLCHAGETAYDSHAEGLVDPITQCLARTVDGWVRNAVERFLMFLCLSTVQRASIRRSSPGYARISTVNGS